MQLQRAMAAEAEAAREARAKVRKGIHDWSSKDDISHKLDLCDLTLSLNQQT